MVETGTSLLFEQSAMNAMEVIRCTLELFGKESWDEVACGTIR